MTDPAVGNPPSLPSCPGCGWLVAAVSDPQTGYRSDAASLGDASEPCPRCSGFWLTVAALQSLVDQARKEASSKSRPPRLQLPSGLIYKTVTYRRCPHCQEWMSRRNYAGCSGILVDQCSDHGTWFDRGELPRLLDFVKNGGLDYAAAQKQKTKREDQGQETTHFLMQPVDHRGGVRVDWWVDVAPLLLKWFDGAVSFGRHLWWSLRQRGE